MMRLFPAALLVPVAVTSPGRAGRLSAREVLVDAEKIE